MRGEVDPTHRRPGGHMDFSAPPHVRSALAHAEPRVLTSGGSNGVTAMVETRTALSSCWHAYARLNAPWQL
eukprot:9056802-Alexandrium_andersonii.AAC.1